MRREVSDPVLDANSATTPRARTRSPASTAAELKTNKPSDVAGLDVLLGRRLLQIEARQAARALKVAGDDGFDVDGLSGDWTQQTKRPGLELIGVATALQLVLSGSRTLTDRLKSVDRS